MTNPNRQDDLRLVPYFLEHLSSQLNSISLLSRFFRRRRRVVEVSRRHLLEHIYKRWRQMLVVVSVCCCETLAKKKTKNGTTRCVRALNV